MPHISIKMLKGRSDEQKKAAAENVSKALSDALGCGTSHITVAVEDYTAEEWQDVFKTEITDKADDVMYIKPAYDPKSLL